jgi:dihydroorotase-like cyclic amidohydrolase
MSTVLLEPENTLRIDAVWMAISVDENGNEGVCAAEINGMWMPLVAADEARLEQIIATARRIAQVTKRQIKIIKLTTREEIEVIPGGAAN